VKGFRVLWFVLMMLVSAILQAQGIVIVEEETRGGKTNINQIQLDKTHMRAESHASGEGMAFVFDDTSKVARVISLDKKTYMEMNAATQQQMQAQLAPAMAQVQAQLANLPPEQRAVVEQMMRGRGAFPGAPGAAAAKTQYRQTGSDKVGKWTCTKYEGYQGPEKVSEVCAVDPKDLGVAPADFEVARHLAEFIRGFMPGAADQIVVPGSAADQGFAGLPVRRTTFLNGKPDVVAEIKDVRREAVPASAFDVPPGFKKEDFGAGRGR